MLSGPRSQPSGDQNRLPEKHAKKYNNKDAKDKAPPIGIEGVIVLGVSRSESLTSKPIGRLRASSVSRQIAKDFVKSLSGPKGDEGPEAQREGLPDCEDLRAILALRAAGSTALAGPPRPQSDFEGRCRAIDGSVRCVRNHGQRLLRPWIGHSTHTGNDGSACPTRSQRLRIQARRNPLKKWKFEQYRRKRRARILRPLVRSLTSARSLRLSKRGQVSIVSSA